MMDHRPKTMDDGVGSGGSWWIRIALGGEGGNKDQDEDKDQGIDSGWVWTVGKRLEGSGEE